MEIETTWSNFSCVSYFDGSDNHQLKSHQLKSPLVIQASNLLYLLGTFSNQHYMLYNVSVCVVQVCANECDPSITH